MCAEAGGKEITGVITGRSEEGGGRVRVTEKNEIHFSFSFCPTVRFFWDNMRMDFLPIVGALFS